ncbi:ABC transporter ATP-binding protein [Maritimibacter sp. HL-12]|uniref:ABC transporter ATP-binding protein n=1 Tax=Maritimibacter sp. HL-12 TaxID=1162418 RepID=UPI000A0EF0BD|nr:ABC transporter ATP-binding protein [Maritimibacter sp. HL-12]SMH38925.1 peptide/nickel transport system ATP-binding protein [Maritimibacter sp. HL-12]
MTLLSIRNLTVRLGRDALAPTILEEVSLDVMPGETLGLVGESGSGKSTLGMSVLRLTPPRLAEGTSGEILWDGRDILTMRGRDLRALRGAEISMILQDPMASLNPVFSIGSQLTEALRRAGRSDLMQAAEAALAEVRIPSPAERLRSYPHQMSGGMRQRVVSAIGLAQEPRLIICDEPTTALDATIQYQFLELLRALQGAHGMAMLFVTHDFGVVARICDRVAVMYAGRIVETGPVREIFSNPRHPYTRALLAAVPSTSTAPDRLPVIEGAPPSIGNRPGGCAFHPRCPMAGPDCQRQPPMERLAPRHEAACWRAREEAAA